MKIKTVLLFICLFTLVSNGYSSQTEYASLTNWSIGTVLYGGTIRTTLTITTTAMGTSKSFVFFVGTKMTEYIMAKLLNYQGTLDPSDNGYLQMWINYDFDATSGLNIGNGFAIVYFANGQNAAGLPKQFVPPPDCSGSCNPINSLVVGLVIKEGVDGICRCGVLLLQGGFALVPNQAYIYAEFSTPETDVDIQVDYWMSKLVKVEIGSPSQYLRNNDVTVTYDPATKQVTNITFNGL